MNKLNKLYQIESALTTCSLSIPMGLRKGICGTKYQYLVYELNRLITENNLPKNSRRMRARDILVGTPGEKKPYGTTKRLKVNLTAVGFNLLLVP